MRVRIGNTLREDEILFFWVIFAFLDPDPHSGSPLNPDPKHGLNSKLTYSRVWQVGVSRCVGNNGAASLKTLTVWMGGLFNPEAFVTATRQCVAQVSYASSF
jgi:hypothetical protein